VRASSLTLVLAVTLLSGCATKSAFMPMDDWITKTLIELDGGVSGQTKFTYAGGAPGGNGAATGNGGSGSVTLSATGVFAYKFDAGAPAGFYVLLTGEASGSDTRTVEVKLDPIPGAARARAVPGHAATVFDCESGGLLDRLFGNGSYHIVGVRQVPLVSSRDTR
jgi:hypothetical protein